ncbi:MAG: NADPH-dependent FMN reductase [Deltaproteobacteria bacterium RBG_13_43_22]|nr:MAG: NADPH-dependent FMN reductase [Deltaproteobacteria bacterium RBG_13_43_22]
MKVLGIYGSPRKNGNSDLLLDQVLEGARSVGAEIEKVYVRDLTISGCRECGGCDKTGECVIPDEMEKIYPSLWNAPIIFLSTPIFFYGLPSQAKTLVDRSQAMWSKRMLEKSPEQRKRYDHGRGYLIAVGATKGKNLFEGVQLSAKYFFDALDKNYEGGLFFRAVEGKGKITEQPAALKEAYDLGVTAVQTSNIER